MSSSFELLADLPLTIDRYELERHQLDISSGMLRTTQTIRLVGGGSDGLGEDVSTGAEDHESFAAAPPLDVAGRYTIATFSRRLDELELWRQPPTHEMARSFRRWGFESAALDLALRQSGISLAEALGRDPRPVEFVVSLRLGEPATMQPLLDRLANYPGLRFKLDPTDDWDDTLVAELSATGAVATLDFKGAYKEQGPFAIPSDPELYRRAIEGLPEAWLEDPALSDELRPLVEPHFDRVTWDAPIHSIDDVKQLEHKPRIINIKPVRFGTLRSLLDTYDHLDAESIRAYGGGFFELSVGRGQLQYLASLFHPSEPNDNAPRGFHPPHPPPGLPTSPLEPSLAPTGFRWHENGAS